MRKQVNYLIVGHVTRDLKGDVFTLGGTAAYSGLTAATLGREVGVVTSCDNALDLSPLERLQIIHKPSLVSTTFENVYVSGKREQKLHSVSTTLDFESIPPQWRSSSLVHLAPVANEVEPQLIRLFDNSFVGITPQGWMREWDSHGNVYYSGWEPVVDILPKADAVVISFEDLQWDEEIVAEFAHHCRVLAVTRAFQGATIHVGGETYVVSAPSETEVDPTGSGDIFAAAFFIHLQESGDPNAAGQFATNVATKSIAGSGLESVPGLSEINTIRVTLKL